MSTTLTPTVMDVSALAERTTAAVNNDGETSAPRPLAAARWDWSGVRRVLVVRLRSIGDTVLATPSLFALRRFLPQARIDLLLEDWVAPLLDGSPDVDHIITIKRRDTASRLTVVRQLRATRYDVAFNLHGGSTAALLMRASGARHRVGYAGYRYQRLHNHAAPPASQLWQRDQTHSAEQQLALLGWTGVPVSDRPMAQLVVTADADARVARRLRDIRLDARLDGGQDFALIHPAAAFDSKTWAAENFARVAEYLSVRGLASIIVAAPGEERVVDALRNYTRVPVVAFTDLTLPEVTALAARARLFVGNDSGIAHIAAAVRTPSVIIFGSSNVAHWRPWTNAPAEVVREEMTCAPCPGYTCAEFDVPQCIRRIPVERVTDAVARVLEESVGRRLDEQP
ncbi:MAG: glycosyltransferase family 9 protein [Acidobacteriota bacterium]|nr:glycosyltransferase family 9 protein [Acidobacteriota bacterium]